MICDATCAAAAAPPAPWACPTPVKGGGDYLLLLKCDYQFTDILDVAEWEAAILAGDIQITPKGKWGKPKGETTTIEIVNGCSTDKLDSIDAQIINFESGNLDKTDLTHFQYAKDWGANYSGFTVIPVDCCGIFYMDADWITAIAAGAPATVATSNPGFAFSWESIPDFEIPDQNTDYVKLQAGLRISIDTPLCGTYIPGLYAALTA